MECARAPPLTRPEATTPRPTEVLPSWTETAGRGCMLREHHHPAVQPYCVVKISRSEMNCS
eukprot:12324282-Alexandrium_andersonii.AAC.1